MKNRRRIFLRTETFERILIRSKNTKSNFRKDSEETINAPQQSEKYRVEIYRIETGGGRKVFECELSGSVEIVETDESF
jgi:hypothetical protein